MFRAGAFAVLAMLLIAAAPIPNSKPDEHRQDSAAQHDGATGAKQYFSNDFLPTIAIPIKVQASQAYQSTANLSEDHDGGPKWTDIAIVILTVGLVVAALLQWNAMKGQETQLRRSVIDARRMANKQAREMQKSLVQTTKAADAAQRSADAAIGAERAWILVFVDEDNFDEAILQRTDGESWPALAETKPIVPRVKFHYENMGKTPAFVREISARAVISKSIPTDMDFTPHGWWWPRETIVPAGGRIPGQDEEGAWLHFSATVSPFDKDEATLLNSEATDRPFIWIYGRALYTDIWGNERSTSFCLAYEAFGSLFQPPEAAEYNKRT